MRVTVIGGGIGGLSAAHALMQAGCDVHVYEQAPQFGEIGAGIQIGPDEPVRKRRATRLQELSAINRKRFHFPDGPAQQERDRLLGASGDRSFAALQWLYEHDPAKIPLISD